jgi:hypothetical protein
MAQSGDRRAQFLLAYLFFTVARNSPEGREYLTHQTTGRGHPEETYYLDLILRRVGFLARTQLIAPDSLPQVYVSAFTHKEHRRKFERRLRVSAAKQLAWIHGPNGPASVRDSRKESFWKCQAQSLGKVELRPHRKWGHEGRYA